MFEPVLSVPRHSEVAKLAPRLKFASSPHFKKLPSGLVVSTPPDTLEAGAIGREIESRRGIRVVAFKRKKFFIRN
jgi:hypothetical protein